MLDTTAIRKRLSELYQTAFAVKNGLDLCDEVDKLREACQAVVDVTEYVDPLSVEVAVIRSRKLCSDALL